MKYLLTFLTTIMAFGMLAVAMPGIAFAGSAKVEVCHVPPGNPENFHTIRINTKTLPSHLAHGDLGEPCNAVCTALCDDDNACTIDDGISDCEQNGCPVNREPVQCDDGNECTADSCEPESGCENTPRLGEACDDGALCTGADTCDADGMCTGTAIDNCCLFDEDCSGSLCDQAQCNLDSNRCGNSPVVCPQPDLCTVSVCAPDNGECVDSSISCDDGFECNLDNGECEASELLAVAYINDDGIDGYSASDDTLIAGFYDANFDGIPNAGDEVRYDMYPLGINLPAGLGNFQIKRFVVVGVPQYFPGAYLSGLAAGGYGMYWEAEPLTGAERLRTFGGGCELNDGITASRPDYVTCFRLNLPTEPDTAVETIFSRSGDQPFFDVDVF